MKYSREEAPFLSTRIENMTEVKPKIPVFAHRNCV
jgi:hypothetical protein